MVSLFESRLFLGGIMSFYGYATFDIIYKKMKRNKEVHKNLVETAEKAINDLNRKDLKFIETSNKKLLFIFGIDNSIDDIDRISVLEQIFQNFTPNALFLERDINHCTSNLFKLKNKIVDNFDPDKGSNYEKMLEKQVKERAADFGQVNSKKQEAIRKELEENQMQKISQDLVPLLIDQSKNLNKREKFKLFESDKDFFYNLLTLSANNLCRKNSKKCDSYFAGVDYGIIKSYIKKKIIIDENFSGEDLVSLSDLSKMTLKQRLSIKKEQNLKNLNNNIYEDVKSYINYEVFEHIQNSKKLEFNQNSLYEQVVIKDVNNILINNIMSNKSFYVGLVVVKNERFDNLYESLREIKSNLNKK